MDGTTAPALDRAVHEVGGQGLVSQPATLRILPPISVAAAVFALGGVASDLVSRSVDFAAPWALVGFDLSITAAALILCGAVSAAVGRAALPLRATAALAAACAAGAVAVRVVQGTISPISRFSAAPQLLAVALILLTAVLAARAQPRKWVAARSFGAIVGSCVALATIRLQRPASDLIPFVADVERRWLLVSAAVASLGAAILAADDADRRRTAAWGVTALICGASAIAVESPDTVQWAGSICMIASTAMGLVSDEAIHELTRHVAAGTRNARGTATRSRRAGTAATTAAWATARSTARRGVRTLEALVLPGPIGDSPPATHALTRADAPMVVVVVLVSVAAIAFRLRWAYDAGAQPIGHGATVVSRAWDVGTANTPMVGMPTSFSDISRDGQAYHPGPMYFYWFAPFVRLLGFRSGALVGSAALNLVGWLVAAWAGFRAGGRAAGVLAWAAAGVVLFAVVKGTVWETVNVLPLLVPMLACILLCWAAAVGGWRAWPLAMLLFSLATQAYLAHAFLTAIPVAWAGAALLVAGRRWPEARRPARRAFVAGLIVMVVSWSPPLIEAVFNDGGNVRKLWYGVVADRPSYGAGGLWDAPAWLLQLPPAWNKLDRIFAPDPGYYVEGLTMVGPILLLALVGIWWATRAEASLAERRLRVLTVLSVGAAAISLSLMPVAFTAFYQVIWLAVISTFTWYSVAMTAVWLLGWRVPSVVAKPALTYVGLGVCVVAIMTLTLRTPTDLRELKGHFAEVDASVPQLVAATVDAVPADRPVMVVGMDRHTEQTVADAITASLIVEGRDVRVEPYIGTFFGPRRAVDADWKGTIIQVFDGSATAPIRGRRIARYVPAGWSQERFDRTTRMVKEFSVQHGPIEIDPIATTTLFPYIDGWDPSLGCDDVAAFEAGTRDLSDLPAGTIARLYADSAISSPQLPADLRAAVERDLGATPTEVWLTEWDGRDGPVESARLLRSGELCSR